MRSNILRILLVVVIALSMTSCSRSLGYRFADTLILWQLDNYVTLESSQRDRVKTHIDEFLQWHAESEMPVYYRLLDEIQKVLVQEQIDQNLLNQYAHQAEALWINIREALYPVIRDELMLFSDEQVDELTNNIRENIEERRNEHSEKSAQERHKDRVDRFQSIFRRVAGRMTPLQERWVESLSNETPDLNPAWLEYREDWLEGFEVALAYRHDAQQFDAYLQPLILAPEALRSENLVQQTALNQERTIATLEQLASSLTDQQKRRSLRRLERFKRDLNAMMRQRDVDFTPP